MDEKEECDDYCPKDFHEMELDDRILKAIAKLGWSQPTAIQERAIPLLIEGKDVLMRARTGSGKTGAFGIPVIQKILNKKMTDPGSSIGGLIMAPTRELCRQIWSHMIELTTKCSSQVRIIDISPQVDMNAQKALLAEPPDILVGTPARVLAHLKAKTINLSSLLLLVIDEADLVFSFGHENDVKEVIKHLPQLYQACLASATLTDDVTSLKKLLLQNAVTLRLEEPHLAPVTQLSHHYIFAEEDNKATFLYALLKLGLVRGKSIIFTNTVDKCYKLKLYLEQFSIRTCVLNSELPATVRCHSVAQFNDGEYDIIIASDELSLEAPSVGIKKKKTSDPKKQKSSRVKDKDSGVARGIDFQFVSNIINFDFPLEVNSYIHRAGRTARGDNQGAVLSFVSVREKQMFDYISKYLQEGLSASEPIFRQHEMKIEDIEGFHYRSRDAWRSATRVAVREARLKEIKQEICNNEKLKGYFADNPKELKTLRHDKFAHTIKIQSHMSDVPDYIVPVAVRGKLPEVSVPDAITYDTLEELNHLTSEAQPKKRKRIHKTSKSAMIRKGNPLLNFDALKKKKKRRR